MMINETNIVSSTLLPVVTKPADNAFEGQKGLIPFTVKLSANKWNEYPRKKGNAAIG